MFHQISKTIYISIISLTFIVPLSASVTAQPRPAKIPKEIEQIKIHPPFKYSYACTQHEAGTLQMTGDALGSDCVINGFKIIEPRKQLRIVQYTNDGSKNSDWYSWQQDVLAPFDAEVIDVYINENINQPGFAQPGRASSIIFRRDDGAFILYAHVREIKVKKGDKVTEGQIIAKVGNNGFSRMPHIHIGAWRGDTPLQLQHNLLIKTDFLYDPPINRK